MRTDGEQDLVEFAIKINRRACGASHRVLDEGKLRGACGRPYATFDGAPIETVIARRAAALLQGINQAHAFADGNKRVAWMCMLYFLRRSGLDVQDTPADEAERFVLAVVEHTIAFDDMARWIADRVIESR
ncbi:type II toxin-antitoxin system death-on-curing family toxin [Actinomyces weissii]|uniref:Type II toxin-antitoxin system death-on-curing family toxin n=1 Tax=Actinomyces weissii TaxID=675090 RepID=A0A7T7M9Z4_9ACTO|nr:type II toxin-antitoxin system death-on-curing family toxin [Actinomyces weissii]QQM67625.1 type II toxin-antitoxin system death-on-curing family toxin [Actinomyces weissii]